MRRAEREPVVRFRRLAAVLRAVLRLRRHGSARRKASLAALMNDENDDEVAIGSP